MTINFIKMHGCGNDFMIIDLRVQPFDIALIEKLSDYKRSVGFDQLLLIDHSDKADAAIRIFNNDGSEVAACGNGSRCVAKLILEETKKSNITIATSNRILNAKWQNELVLIDMGKAIILEESILFAVSYPTKTPKALKIEDLANIPEIPGRAASRLARDDASIVKGSLVDIGNPHIVLNNAEDLDISIYGPKIESDHRFPDKVNVNFAQVVNRNLVDLRVWERGAGATLACGSGACATFFYLYKQGVIDNNAVIRQAGGDLKLSIENDEIFMAGEACISYRGAIVLHPQQGAWHRSSGIHGIHASHRSEDDARSILDL